MFEKQLSPKVNIITVNYNCWQETIACVESVLKSTYSNFNIFIVDNNSTDESINNILSWGESISIDFIPSTKIYENKLPQTSFQSKVILIQNHSNKGFGAGNNLIISHLLNFCDNQFIWLLNPDTIVEKEVMQDLVNITINKDKKISGNLIINHEDRSKIMFYGGFKVKKLIHGIIRVVKKSKIDTLDAITGASLFVNISVFRDLGVLPEEYFMYWEETDFCTKAKRSGYSFEVNSRSIIYDRVGSVSNSNFLREYLYLLNGLRYYKKYYTSNLPLILISTIAKLLKAYLFENKAKKRAVKYAHIDFLKLLRGRKINIVKRIQQQNINDE